MSDFVNEPSWGRLNARMTALYAAIQVEALNKDSGFRTRPEVVIATAEKFETWLERSP